MLGEKGVSDNGVPWDVGMFHQGSDIRLCARNCQIAVCIRLKYLCNV